MASFPLLWAALAVIVRGVRDTQVFESNATKKPPRRCTGTWGSFDNCCSCGPRNGGHQDQELNEWVDGCEYVVDKTVHTPTCCPIWAVDCKEDEPEFQKGLKRDCKVSKDDCEKGQCHDRKQAYDKAYRSLQSALHGSKAKAPERSSWQKKLQEYVTGKSNKGFRCPCGCGKLKDEEKMICESVKAKTMCSKNQPCCTKKTDCEEEDPWREAIESAANDLKQKKEQSQRDHDASIETLESEAKTLKELLGECVSTCKVDHQKACVEDLKEVLPKGGSGWFGLKKDVTRQEQYVTELYKKMYSDQKSKDAQWKEEVRELEEQERQRQKALTDARNKKWREEAYSSLKNYVGGAAEALSDKVRGKQCCKCTMSRSTHFGLGKEFLSDLCSAPSCSVYQGKCESVSKNLCKRYTACPADHDFYVKGGDRKQWAEE